MDPGLRSLGAMVWGVIDDRDGLGRGVVGIEVSVVVCDCVVLGLVCV